MIAAGCARAEFGPDLSRLTISSIMPRMFSKSQAVREARAGHRPELSAALHSHRALPAKARRQPLND
jgi:hypothetical protein